MVGMVFFLKYCADLQYYHFTPTECAHRSTVHFRRYFVTRDICIRTFIQSIVSADTLRDVVLFTMDVSRDTSAFSDDRCMQIRWHALMFAAA